MVEYNKHYVLMHKKGDEKEKYVGIYYTYAKTWKYGNAGEYADGQGIYVGRILESESAYKYKVKTPVGFMPNVGGKTFRRLSDMYKKYIAIREVIV